MEEIGWTLRAGAVGYAVRPPTVGERPMTVFRSRSFSSDPGVAGTDDGLRPVGNLQLDQDVGDVGF